MDNNNGNKKTGHLFNIEMMIEANSNGVALEKLTHILNNKDVVDYKINSGIQLGSIIDSTIEEHQKMLTFKKEEEKKAGKKLEKNMKLFQIMMTKKLLTSFSILKTMGIWFAFPF